MPLLHFCLGAQWSLWLWVCAVCQSLISGSVNRGDLQFNPLARWATGSITTLCFECLFIFHNEPKHSPSAFIDISVPKSISAAPLPYKHSSGPVIWKKAKRRKKTKLFKSDEAELKGYISGLTLHCLFLGTLCSFIDQFREPNYITSREIQGQGCAVVQESKGRVIQVLMYHFSLLLGTTGKFSRQHSLSLKDCIPTIV